MNDSHKPHYLWLARTLPVPLDAGDRIYTAKLADAVARAGARVTFLGLANPDAPHASTEVLGDAVDWRLVPGPPNPTWRALLSAGPLVAGRFGTRAYRDMVRDLLRSEAFDGVILDQYGMGWALDLLDDAATPDRPVPVFHLSHDFETEVTAAIARDYRGDPLRKIALQRNARLTAKMESRLARRCDLIVAISDHDRQAFERLAPGARTVVISPGYAGPRTASRELTTALPRTVAIVGSYRWVAKQMNLSRFLEVADPLFAEAGVRLEIVGDAPPDYRAQWEGRVRASTFLGFVDDLEVFLNGCRMGLVVEATGGGFKLKVLDYVFTRTPVAALADALGGQSAAVTSQFIVADNAEAMVKAIIAALDDLPRLNAMQQGAYDAAGPLYDWAKKGKELLGEFNGHSQ